MDAHTLDQTTIIIIIEEVPGLTRVLTKDLASDLPLPMTSDLPLRLRDPGPR